MVKFALCVLFSILSLLTCTLSYDPATCIECRETHMCKSPDCFCCRDEMPLGSHNIPQMVFFTFDDAVTPQVADYYRELFDSKRKNPNGCPISMTLFISHSNTVYRLVREFYDKGMEIASHSVTHSHPNSETFKREAKKQRENLARKARIPVNEIVGWRSPFLEPLGDTQPSVLKELGYEYDATLTITKKGNNDKAVIPFTLDHGWPYDCKIKSCPTKSHKGFWEVPVVSVKDYLNKYDCVYVDGCNNPPPSENLAYKFLWDNFQGYYKTNRAPMGINMHASWFYYPDRKAAMNRFIKELVKLDDVYILSVKQVLAWLKHPTPLHQIKQFKPWLCAPGAKPATTLSKNLSSKQKKEIKTLDRNKIYQKMAEQRNQWRREQLQRQRYHMASFQNRPSVPPAQSQNSMQHSLHPGLLGSRVPSPAGPPRPIIPPLAPNHPMINFWWRPPQPVLPPRVRHELDMRRNVELHQMEHQRRQESLTRQRNEQERQRQLKAQQQVKEQQRLKLLGSQQEEQRKRQELVKRQKGSIQNKPQLTELKTKQISKVHRKTEIAKGNYGKNILITRRSHQSKSDGNIDLRQEQGSAKSNQSIGLSDSGMLVEYLLDDASTNHSPPIQKVDVTMHRPPLREVHERQMIKHKLKLQPEIVKKDHIQNEIDAKSSAQIIDGLGLPSDNGNSLMLTRIKEQNDPHSIMHSSTTEFRHNMDLNEQPIVKSQVQSHSSESSKQSFTKDQSKNNVKVRDHSGQKPKSPNIKLLDSILQLKPSERITYLHELSLEDLKSLQSELRKRLASDSTPVKQPTTPSVDGTVQSVENKFTDNTSLSSTPDNPTYDQKSETVTTTQTRSSSQSFLINRNIEKSLTDSSTSTIAKLPSDTMIRLTVPGSYASEIFAQYNFTDSITTAGKEMTTTGQVLKNLASTYDNMVNFITEITTKIPTTTTTTTATTTTDYVTTTKRKTTTTVADTTTEPYIQVTTEKSPTEQLGSKSLWYISDIFDMNNHMNGEHTKTPLVKSPPKSKKFSSIIPIKSTSISLFSVDDQNTNDLSLDPIQKSLQVNLNQLGIDPTQFANFKQKSTMASKTVSRPAVYSKSLFKVNGYESSNSFVPSVNGYKSNSFKASSSIPNSFPTKTARLITGGRQQSDKNENSVAIKTDSILTISYASTLPPKPETTTAPTTPMAVTESTSVKTLLPKLMVNKHLRQLVKPMYLFQNSFNSFTPGNGNPPQPENNRVSIPAIISQDNAIDTLSLSSLSSETGALIQEPEYLSLVASSHTPGSVCNQGSNCFLPDCVCKSDTTPNNLFSKQIPQIVYLTIDGSLNFNTYSKIRQLFSSKRTNPNGCPIKGTLFMTDAGSNYRIADLLHSNGLEIGLGGLSSRPQSSGEELENNIVSLTQQITNSTSVSPIDIKGWRSPRFKPIGDSQFDILRNYSLYDSSLVIHRQGKHAKLWPFTLDFGWNEDCKHGACPSRDHPGVMEVPVIPYISPDNTTSCEYTDACSKQPASEKETLDYLMKNFNSYYKTNRAPFAIRLKQIWFHWYYRSNLKGLTKFLDKILEFKDVYVTSVSNMLDWVKDPTPLSQLDSFQPWKC